MEQQKKISQASERLHAVLQKMLGLHRQLLDAVRKEKEALIGADLKGVHEATCSKEALIEMIRAQESARLAIVGEMSLLFRKPAAELTLPKLIIEIQGADLKAADQLRSVYTALGILVQRIREQNEYNQTLVQKSLHHIQEMKKNVLGESAPNTSVYTQRGQKQSSAGGSRLISKEA